MDSSDELPNDIKFIPSKPNVSDQRAYIKKIEEHLDRGGDIDVLIAGVYPDHAPATILLYSVLVGLEQVTKFTLSRGANLAKQIQIIPGRFRTTKDIEYRRFDWNILELAVLQVSRKAQTHRVIYELVKEKALKIFAPYGLGPLHLACALGNIAEVDRLLGVSDINEAIDAQSPVWAGVTPLLLAAKFRRNNLVTRLLDLGASPKARDSGKNTPLHYCCCSGFFDERLFIYDEEDTYGHLNGLSHFHMAIFYLPKGLEIIENYLDIGVSPNIRAKQKKHPQEQVLEGSNILTVGSDVLYIALSLMKDKMNQFMELARLFLERGFEVNKKCDYNLGYNILGWFLGQARKLSDDTTLDIAHLFIEFGANVADDQVSNERAKPLRYFFINKLYKLEANQAYRVQALLRCVKRMRALNVIPVNVGLNQLYSELLSTPGVDGPGLDRYEESCLKEVKDLDRLGLREQLGDNSVIKGDFGRRFEPMVDSLPQMYPIYGPFLKIQVKRRLIALKKKRRRVIECVPKVVFIASHFCDLPDNCAEEILWNFSLNEIHTFLSMFVTGNKRRFVKKLELEDKL